jgi:DinB superfamily
MTDLLAWALHNARQQTLALVAGVPDEQLCLQATPGEHPPAWILGHILLGDVYLLSLLDVEAIPPDFPALLGAYGPESTSGQTLAVDASMHLLVERLRRTGAARSDAVRRMCVDDLGRTTPDEFLVRSQPTIGHHLQALLFHEGYHAGQLAAWRRSHGLPAVRWVLAPEGV